MLRIKEIIMVTNTIMITTTSIRHPETINTISLLDRTSQVNSLELSREGIDKLETIRINVLLRIIMYPVVNLATSNLMI